MAVVLVKPNKNHHVVVVRFLVVLGVILLVLDQICVVHSHPSFRTITWKEEYNSTTTTSTQDDNPNNNKNHNPFMPLVGPGGMLFDEMTTTTITTPPSAKRRPLRFVHIPKTGGSSIEIAAAQQGYLWGNCMLQWSLTHSSVCQSLPKVVKENQSMSYVPPYKFPFQCPLWHVPVQYLPSSDEKSPYEGYDLFAVIRNPYTKAVSQYYYRCSQLGYDTCFQEDKSGDTKERLNEKIQSTLKKHFLYKHRRRNTQDYFVEGGHWIPQFDYIYNTTVWDETQKQHNHNNIRSHQYQHATQMELPPKMVQHVLRHEYMNDEFQMLMTMYGQEYEKITLPTTREKSRNNDEATSTTTNEWHPRWTAHDLSQKTMQMIEHVYKLDFELGPYPKLSSSKKKQSQTELE